MSEDQASGDQASGDQASGSVVVGIDLGSVRAGVCVIAAGRPTWSATVAVDRANVGPAVREIETVIAGSGARRVAVEWSPVYVPEGSSGQAAAGMARAHETMAIMLDRLETSLGSQGVSVVKIHPNTVRARLEIKREEGESTDGAVRRVIAGRIGAELAGMLATVDEVDACAVAIADVIGERGPIAIKGKRRNRKPNRPIPRKCGNKFQRRGHPSDAAFEALMADRDRNRHGGIAIKES